MYAWNKKKHLLLTSVSLLTMSSFFCLTWTDCPSYDSYTFCFRSLELSAFNVKSLLRRAAAYEALERYRQAYVDYKTALQIDCNIAAAHDGTNRSAGVCHMFEADHMYFKIQSGSTFNHTDVFLHRSDFIWMHVATCFYFFLPLCSERNGSKSTQAFFLWVSHSCKCSLCFSGWQRLSRRQTVHHGEKSFPPFPQFLCLWRRNLPSSLQPTAAKRSQRRSRMAPGKQTNAVQRFMKNYFL